MATESRIRRRSSATTQQRVELGRLRVVDSPPGDEHLNREIGVYYSTHINQWPSFVEYTRDQLNPGPPYIIGGDFDSMKATLPQQGIQGHSKYRGYVYGWGHVEYNGGFAEPWYTDEYNDLDYLEVGEDQTDTDLYPDLKTYGAEAYDKTRPKLDSAGLGIFIAEAKDLPRQLRTSAKGFHDIWDATQSNRWRNRRKLKMLPDKAAEHFLNHQFGWRPFINDLSKFYSTYQKSADYMKHVSRNNGRWMKRERSVRHTESEEVIFDSNLQGVSHYRVAPEDNFIQSLRTAAHYQIILRQSTQIWSAGTFKYYRPEFDLSDPSYDGKINTMRRHMAMYGATINPSLVWEATPWSWLVDWFSNTGQIIENWSRTQEDNLVSKWFYIMHRKVRTIVLRQSVTFNTGGEVVMEWERKFDIKRRMGQISPYGFNLAWADLSPTQIGILSAIGLGRVPRRRQSR